MAGNDLKKTTDPKPAAVKVFNCPSCGGGVVLRAIGQSVTAVCGSCDSIIDSSNENYQIIGKSSKSGIRDQVIPLGQRGRLHGVLWEVIGYMERSDGTLVYTWSEYLLFNPIKGFRWLTEFDGHWNYILTTKSQPEVDTLSSIGSYGQKTAKYMNKNYFLFNKGQAKVTYVIGEFYWHVKQGETVQVEDYISPPEILSSEKSNNEIIWSIGEYIQPDVVKSAFQITNVMPLRTNVAPNQSSTVTQAANNVGKYWALFLGIIFVIQMAMILFSKNEIVYSEQFLFSSIDKDKLKVSSQFDLKHGASNLKVTLSAPVQNNWIEVQSDLVNDDNGKTLNFEQGVEYYSGSDGDGYWSEGNQTNELIISSIPEGKYHLNIEASGPALPVIVAPNIEKIETPVKSEALTETFSTGNSFPVKVVVFRDVVTWSNFLWAVFLLSIFPIFILWRNRSFEMSRWSQSDFSPYYQHKDEE